MNEMYSKKDDLSLIYSYYYLVINIHFVPLNVIPLRNNALMSALFPIFESLLKCDFQKAKPLSFHWTLQFWG